MQRLDVPFHKKHPYYKGRRFYATVFGLTRQENHELTTKLTGLNSGLSGDSINWDCYKFLRETNILR